MTKPKCTASRHHYIRDARIGVRENPGVFSRGGTHIATAYVCTNCGVEKVEHTDIVTRRTKVVYGELA